MLKSESGAGLPSVDDSNKLEALEEVLDKVIAHGGDNQLTGFLGQAKEQNIDLGSETRFDAKLKEIISGSFKSGFFDKSFIDLVKDAPRFMDYFQDKSLTGMWRKGGDYYDTDNLISSLKILNGDDIKFIYPSGIKDPALTGVYDYYINKLKEDIYWFYRFVEENLLDLQDDKIKDALVECFSNLWRDEEGYNGVDKLLFALDKLPKEFLANAEIQGAIAKGLSEFLEYLEQEGLLEEAVDEIVMFFDKGTKEIKDIPAINAVIDESARKLILKLQEDTDYIKAQEKLIKRFPALKEFLSIEPNK